MSSYVYIYYDCVMIIAWWCGRSGKSGEYILVSDSDGDEIVI